MHAAANAYEGEREEDTMEVNMLMTSVAETVATRNDLRTKDVESEDCKGC